MLDNPGRVIQVSALDHVMNTLTEEARTSLSSGRDGSQISGRYMAATNVIPGVHVSVLAKL